MTLLVAMALLGATDPYAAYESQHYDRALESFLAWQVDHPDDPRLAYNVGNTLYRQGDFERAAQAFGMAQKLVEQDAQALSPQEREALAAKAAYNRGNALAMARKLEEAVQSYERALEVRPNHQDAQANLEAVKRLLEMQPPEQEPSPEEQDERQQDEEQDDQQRGQQGQSQERREGEAQPGEAQQGAQGAEPEQDQPDAGTGADGSEPQPAATDAASAQERAPESGKAPAEAGAAESPNAMTPEQARRLLRAFGDDQLGPKRRGKSRATPPGGKPW